MHLLRYPREEKLRSFFFGQPSKDQSLHRIGHLQQASHAKPAVPSNPVARAGTTLGPSKYTYRSLLADIIQPQDFRELCSVLVVMSEVAAKNLAEERNTMEKRLEDQPDISLASSSQEGLQRHKEFDVGKFVADDRSGPDRADKVGLHDSSSDGADAAKGRPMSPGTLALMCDEEDTIFMTASSSGGVMGHGSNTTSDQGMTEAYAEQERIVLTKFRECLNKLITLGEIKETNCSSSARTALWNSNDPVSNGINVRTGSGYQKGPSNGVAKTVIPPAAKASTVVSTTAAASNTDHKTPGPPQNGRIN